MISGICWKMTKIKFSNLRSVRLGQAGIFASVQSASNPSRCYDVFISRIRSDKFSCSCPDFMFRARECKHIKLVRDWVSLKQQLLEI